PLGEPAAGAPSAIRRAHETPLLGLRHRIWSFAGPKAGFAGIKNPVPGQGTGYGTRGTTLVDVRSIRCGPLRAHKKSRPPKGRDLGESRGATLLDAAHPL